jgi:diacylglycerol O-acyltransferase
MLALDTAHTPGQVGTVDIFDAGPNEFDYEHLIALIRDRISFVPRYRQRVRAIPARLAGPVWVDDEDFDLTFHVRRSALPRPGTMEQLREFVGRVLARRLDRSRPLWEMYLVEGLQDNRFALVTKSHLSLVDGIDTVDIGQVLLDATQHSHSTPTDTWRPSPEPSGIELLTSAVWQAAQDPSLAVENVRGALTGALGVAVAVGEAVGGVSGALGELAENALRGGRPPSDSPLAGVVSEQRRVATVSAALADLKAIREEHSHTINDVVLAMITGALRAWLLTRGESLTSSSSLTALVPMSVTEDGGEPTSLGSQVAPHLQRLPIGEANALMRLHQVAYGTRAHKDTGRAVGARSLSDIAGFAPTTLHALGVRVSAEVLRKQHDVLITNVPGPQVPLYAAGSEMVASYPVLPLAAGHLLAIGVTSYNAQVYFGLTADRDALTDLPVLAQCLSDALEELLDTTVRAVHTRQPTRKAPPAAKRAAAKKAAAKQQAVERSAAAKRTTMRNIATKASEIGATAIKTPAARKSAAGAKTAVAKTGVAKTGVAKTGVAGPAGAKAAAKKAPARSLATTTTKQPAAKKATTNRASTNRASTNKASTNKASGQKAGAKKAPAKRASGRIEPATPVEGLQSQERLR